MSQLKVSRFVELHDLAVQRNVQSNSRDRDLNLIRVCSFVVSDLLTPMARYWTAFMYAPIPQRWIRCRLRVEDVAAREVFDSGGGSGAEEEDPSGPLVDVVP